MHCESSLLSLFQFVSPSFPLGTYNYSEGLEYAIENQTIESKLPLQRYLSSQLQWGAIRVEGTVIAAIAKNENENETTLQYWNSWLNGTRETKELRQQSIQMGNSLLKLLGDLDEEKRAQLDEYKQALGKNCHYAIAFGIAVALWEIDPKQAVLGYLHSWVSNLVSAGVKLIPLGQTQGQQIIYNLHPVIAEVAKELMTPKDEHLYACTWGLSLASMNHETQYTRLFRS